MANTNKKTRSPSSKVVSAKKKIQPIVTTELQAPEIMNDIPPFVEENQFSMAEEIPASESTAEEMEPLSLWSAIKNSPQFINMLISLACSFLVSASFYWAGKNMMKIKFGDMFEEKLPRYQNLVYGIGEVKNIDIDRVVLRDDLSEQYFTTDAETNSIAVDINKIMGEYQKTQPVASLPQDVIVPKKVLQDKLKGIAPQISTEQENTYSTGVQATAEE